MGCKMAKTIVPKKVIIELSEGVAGAILLYVVNEDGNISKPKSVSVTGGVDAEALTSIIADAKTSAEQSEGL